MKLNEIIDRQDVNDHLNHWFKIVKGVKYLIDDDGFINVEGDCILKFSMRDGKIPLKFDTVKGMFDCDKRNLSSLEGAPINFAGEFKCADNRLMSLIGAPKHVSSNFFCQNNPLTSLEGLPESVGNMIVLSYSENLPLLRLIFVKDYKHLFFHSSSEIKINKLNEVNEIITTYKGQGQSGALAASAELMRSGYRGNARR